MVVQPDGKILLAGTGLRELRGFGALVRYLPNGELDPAFADDGVLLDSRFNPFSALALQSDGRILVGVPQRTSPRYAERLTFGRYLAGGLRDSGFGKESAVKEPTGFVPTAILPRDDGRFIAAANAPYEPDAPWRGSVGWARGDDVSLLQGGKILVAAEPLGGVAATFALACFNADGTLDRSFGSGGLVTTDTCPGSEAQKRRAKCLPSARVRLRADRLANGSFRLRTVVGSNSRAQG